MKTDKLVADILFKGGAIVTLDKHNPYISNGAIAIAGKEIVAIGSVSEVNAEIAAARRTVDFSGLTMMPGLIDGHNHLFQHLGKTLGDGLSLLPWLAKFMMPLAAEINREDAIHAVRLGALNSVLCGTTTIVDNHYAPVDETTIISAAQALEQIGVRGVVARGIYGRMVEGGRRMNSDPRLFRYTSAEELEITRNCIREKPAGSLVEVWPAPENVVYVDPDLMLACHELATEFDVSWHSHCSESRFEVDIFTSIYNMRPGNWLHEQGILDNRITLAHGIWLDEEEIALLGDANASIVHNPREQPVPGFRYHQAWTADERRRQRRFRFGRRRRCRREYVRGDEIRSNVAAYARTGPDGNQFRTVAVSGNPEWRPYAQEKPGPVNARRFGGLYIG